MSFCYTACVLRMPYNVIMKKLFLLSDFFDRRAEHFRSGAVTDAHTVDAHIEEKLKKLGADIRREEVVRTEDDDLY